MIHVSGKSTTKLTKVQPGDIQPNATDLRIGKVFKINSDEFMITNDYKQHRGSVQVQVQEDEFFHLEPGDYEVVMENEISVGVNEAGFIITRSSLNRNNVRLFSGLYDSLYSGVVACIMHVGSGTMKIKPGTRIGQYIMWSAEMIGDGYDGDYGHGKDHDKKYS